MPIREILQKIFDYLQVKQRWILCFFSFLAIINAYSIRLCLDFMLNRIIKDYNRQTAVPAAKRTRTLRKWPTAQLTTMRSRQKAGQVEGKWRRRSEVSQLPPAGAQITTSSISDIWSKEVQVLVTTSFYMGYMITHIPGGRCAERFGGKWILGTSIFISAVLTLLTPTIVRCGGPKALIVLRFLIGFSEGPTFPAVSAMLAQWVPESERGFLCSCVLSGGEIGITFVQLVSGFTLNEQDWPIAFYVVGSGAMLWFVGFVFVCYSHPDDSPFIQNRERDYINSRQCDTLANANNQAVAPATAAATRAGAGAAAGAVVPWYSILSNAPIWALIVANMQHDWNQQELEQLLQDIQATGSSLLKEVENNLRVTAPHLCNWLASLTSGALSDYLIAEGFLTRTQTRRLMSFLVFISISMYMIHDKEHWGRTWSIFAFGAYYAGIKLLPLDMSPNFAGTVMGISNGLGALPGLLMPMLKELESEYAIVGSMRAALWLFLAGYISGDVQSYDRVLASVVIQN